MYRKNTSKCELLHKKDANPISVIDSETYTLQTRMGLGVAPRNITYRSKDLPDDMEIVSWVQNWFSRAKDADENWVLEIEPSVVHYQNRVGDVEQYFVRVKRKVDNQYLFESYCKNFEETTSGSEHIIDIEIE